MAATKKINLDSVKLGMKLVELKKRYEYDDVVKFLKGEKKDSYYLHVLKPFWDEYGYKEINDLIISLETPAPEETK